jgi:Homeodomain-like domain
METVNEKRMMEKIELTPTQRKLLKELVQARTSPQRLVLRAKLLLDCAESGKKTEIGKKHGVGRDTVRRWSQRWQSGASELNELESEHQAGTLSESRYRRELAEMLADAPRPGHPVTFTQEQKAQIIALGSEKPEKADVPITHWTGETLKEAVIAKGIVPTISRSRVSLFLKGSPAPTASEPLLGESQHRRLAELHTANNHHL